MKLKLYIFLLAFSCQFMSFGQTLDQSNTSATAAVESLFGGSTQNLSQSFTVGNSGQLSRISVNVDNVTNGPTLYVNCDLIIYNGEGFGGTVLGTYGFAVPDNVSGEFAINFAPIAVTSNQIITFKIVANTTSLGRVTLLTTNDTYAGGVFYNDALQAIATRDLWFKTYVTQSAATHLNFDGINDAVVIPNSSLLQFGTDNLTFEAMIKISSAQSNYSGIITKASITASQNFGLQFVVIGNKLSVEFQGNISVTGTTDLNDSNWHHVALVVNRTTNNIKLYVDGVLDGSLTNGTIGGANLSNPVNMFIGKDRTSTEFLEANIDEVRIWNVARTAEQLFGSRFCELQGSETGLIAYYKFNQGLSEANNSTIASLSNTVSGGVNGTFTNFALNGTTSNFLAGSPVTTGSIIPSIATVNTPVFYNQGATATILTATTGTNGNGLVWYTSATGGTGNTTAPTPITTTAGNTSYWVASTNANGCESARTEIVVTVNAAATHLNFGGTTDYVNCGNSPSLQITGTAITLEAYVKFNSFGAASFLGNIINKDEVAIASGYMLRAGGNGVVNFVVANNGWNEVFSPDNSVGLNTWHHVAGVYDGVNSKIYIDGVQVVSQPLSITIGNANVNLNIGKDPSYSDRFIDASIDEVRIWNRALPIAEIQNNINCELPSPTTQTGLVAYYQFNQGFDASNNTTITTLTDSSASANNGTLTNFALTGTTSNWLSGSTIVTGTNCAVLSSSSFDVASNVNLYPNPTKGSVNIDLNNLTNVSVSVYDLNGRSILNQELSVNENSIDISNLQSGMYLFKIKSQEGEIVKKVIKN